MGPRCSNIVKYVDKKGCSLFCCFCFHVSLLLLKSHLLQHLQTLFHFHSFFSVGVAPPLILLSTAWNVVLSIVLPCNCNTSFSVALAVRSPYLLWLHSVSPPQSAPEAQWPFTHPTLSLPACPSRIILLIHTVWVSTHAEKWCCILLAIECKNPRIIGRSKQYVDQCAAWTHAHVSYHQALKELPRSAP